MLKSTASIMESLASIKANTANHKEGLDEIKDDFEKHVEKEEQQSKEFTHKIESVKKSIINFQCPDHDAILKIERRLVEVERRNEGRRQVDREAKEREVLERAEKDQKIAEDIASLKSTRKYNYLTASGIYIILAAVLKKLFS
ncbi:MAG: hypothetical protein GY928_25970 [Colwellia sp.]|nr:hypothetical protein [Colwellia sp.]